MDKNCSLTAVFLNSCEDIKHALYVGFGVLILLLLVTVFLLLVICCMYCKIRKMKRELVAENKSKNGKTINDLDNPLYNDLPMADGQQLADRQTEPQQENYHVIKLEELPAHYDAVASSPSVRPESYDDVLLSVYDKVGRDENLETEEEIRCVKPPAPPPPPCAPNPSPGPPSIVQKSYYDDVILSNKTSRDKNQKSKDREKPPAPPPKEQYSTVPMEMKAVVVVSEDMPHQSYNHLIHEPVSHKSVTVPASVQREYSSFGSTSAPFLTEQNTRDTMTETGDRHNQQEVEEEKFYINVSY